MTFHRSILRRRDKDGNLRIITPLEPGDTAECSTKELASYLATGFEIVEPLHAENDPTLPINRFSVRFVGIDTTKTKKGKG